MKSEKKQIMRSFILSLCVIISLWAHADEIKFTVSAPSQVAAGEAFQISFSLNTQGGSNFKAPTFKGMNIHFGPQRSFFSSTQNINGRISQNITESYVYQGDFPSPGTYNIGTASITVNGTTYTSQPFSIKVVKGNPNTQPAQQQGRTSSSATSGQVQASDIKAENLFVKAAVSNSRPYQGEQVVVSYKIYTNVPVSQYTVSKSPNNKGFWVENLSDNRKQPEVKKEMINGKEYLSADVFKLAAFAQETGKLVIDPMELDVIAQIKAKQQSTGDPFFDMFFNDAFFNNVQNVEKKITSNALNIQVEPLPADAPETFQGFVGKLKMHVELDKSTVKAFNAITMRITFSGEGNLSLIESPVLSLPPDFEVYDPQVSDRISRTANGISGNKTLEYIIIPKNEGKFTIHPMEYAYFDPAEGKYKILSSPSFDLTVEKGDGTSYASQNAKKGNVANSDIAFIQTKQPEFKTPKPLFFLSNLYFLCLLIPIAGLIAFYIIRKYILKRQSDEVLMKNKGAVKAAKRCLKKAEMYLKHNKRDEFYVEISQALWGFVSNRYNIPMAELSIEKAEKTLSNKQIDANLIKQFVKTLEDCEFERFAPIGNSNQAMKDMYDQALSVIYQTVAFN